MSESAVKTRQIIDQDGTALFDTRVHFRDKKSGKIVEEKSKPYRRVAWKNAEGDRMSVNVVRNAQGVDEYFDDAGFATEKPEVPVTMPRKGKGLPEGVPHGRALAQAPKAG